MCQRHPVSHRFGTITDCRGRRWKPRPVINRRISVLIQNLQFIMEEYRVFPKGRFPRLVKIRHQPAFHFLAGLRMKPSGTRRLYDHRAEQAVNICRFLAAPGICHIMEEKNALCICIPSVFNFVVCRAVLIESGTCPVRSRNII